MSYMVTCTDFQGKKCAGGVPRHVTTDQQAIAVYRDFIARYPRHYDWRLRKCPGEGTQSTLVVVPIPSTRFALVS